MAARRAIYATWGKDAHNGMIITACETGRTWNLWASNGQYKGLFQMGNYERATCGHAWNIWTQARAAWCWLHKTSYSSWSQCI